MSTVDSFSLQGGYADHRSGGVACGRAPESAVGGDQECPRNFIRLAANAQHVTCRRAMPRLAALMAAGVIGGLSFLVIPLHNGCPDDLSAVNFGWFVVDYFLCFSYCTVAYLATFNGLYPGARWGLWFTTWLAMLLFQFGAVFFCWQHDAVKAVFAITIGAASGYEITLFILLAYALRFWLFPCLGRSTRPPAVLSAQWEAVENKIQLTSFREEAPSHCSWLKQLLRDQSLNSSAPAEEAGAQPRMVRRPEYQLLLCCAFMLCLSGCYPVCNAVFAAVLKGRNSAMDAFVGLSAFSLCAFTAKTVLAGVGFLCDSGVVSANFSGYYAGHFLGSFYYFSYYRAMFEHVSGWSDFVALQATHLVLEWVKHVVRATDCYYQWARKFSSRGPQWYQVAAKTVFLSRQPNVSSDDWARFMAVETALQAFIVAVSLLAYATGYTVLRFVGSARSAFRPFVDHMANDEYNQLMLQLAAQVVTESVNIGLMELWFRRRLGGRGALKRFPLLYERNSFFVFVLAWCTLHGANPWIQWMPQQFCTDAAAVPREAVGVLQ